MQTELVFRAMLLGLVLCAVGAAPVAAAPYGEDPTIVWERLLGGSGTDYGYSVRQTSDGGYILVGASDSNVTGDVTGTNHGGYDCWVVKLDTGGLVQWQRLLGGNANEYGLSVQQTMDGGYVLGGYSSSSLSGDVTSPNHGSIDYWVVKLGNAGTIQWQRLLGGSGSDFGQFVQQTTDGGYVLVGYSGSSQSGDVTSANHGSTDCWVVKLDADGLVQWQQLLGGSGSDFGHSVQQTTDGGYVLDGSSSSSQSGDITGVNHGGSDCWVAKLDGTGDIQWQRLLGGRSNDYGQTVQQTTDGGYVLVGSSESSGSGDVTGPNHGARDLWTVKLDGAGTLQWQRLLGGSGTDYGYSVQQTSDGGYILAGHSSSSVSGDVTGVNHGAFDYWVVKLDNAGTLQWQRLLGGSSVETGASIEPTPDGGYVLVGFSYSSQSADVVGTNHGIYDYWVVNLRPEPFIRLEAGWNLVSVPAVLAAGSDTASVFSGVDTGGHSIFLYDAAAKSWNPMTASTKVRPLDGIWVYSTTATTVPLAFETNPQAVPPVKDLAAGWNAIGHAGTKAVTARDALSPVAGTWSLLQGFDAPTQAYEDPIFTGGSGDYSDSREMLAGKGYWLYMRGPGQLAGRA